MKSYLVSTAIILLFNACVVLGAGVQGKSAMITKLKPMHLTTSLGTAAKPGATIVASDRYQAVASQLQSQIEQKTGIRLPIVSDVEWMSKNPAALPDHVIALGHYGTNKLIERLYFNWYVVVDGVQPGIGGYVLQTIHNPGGMGKNVVIVGGSDDEGVARASKRLIETIESHGVELPRMFEIELGAGKELVLERGEKVLDPARTWPTIHPMEVIQSIAEAGILYQYTGDERFAEAYKKHLCNWLDGAPIASTSDDFYRIFVTWDLLEESPVFTDEDRLRITNQLLADLRKEYAPYPPEMGRPNYNLTNFHQMKGEFKPRSNHTARFSVGFFFGGRYFQDYYRLPEAAEWLKEVRTYFKPQMQSFDVMEGSVDHIAMITLTDTVTYALADDQSQFLSKDVLGRIADKGLMKAFAGQPLERSTTPFLFWCLAAHLFDRPEYLQPMYAADPTMGMIRVPWLNGWQLGRSFWDGTIPDPGDQPAEWVQAMPIGRQYFDNCHVYGAKNVRAENAFEFLVVKPDQGKSQFLMLGGHNTGTYSDNNANAIRALWMDGRRWLSGGGRVSTAQKQNSVVIVRNGQAAAMPAFARLDHADSDEGYGVTRTSMRDYNGADWYRNIVSVPGNFILVIDEVIAREAGDYLLENRWMSYSHAAFDDDDALFVQKSGDEAVALRLTGTGWQRQYMVPWLYSDYLTAPVYPFAVDAGSLDPAKRTTVVAILARRWAGKMSAGQKHQFATLLAAEPFGKPAAYRLTQTDNGIAVTRSDGTAWSLNPQPDGIWSVGSDPQTASPAVAGDKPSSTSALTAAGSARETSRILATSTVNGLLAVGTSSGQVHLYDESGKVADSIEMPGRVLALLGIDLDRDGRQELVASSEEGGVRAFDAEGKPLWTFELPAWKPNPSWRQSMGERTNVVSDLAAMRNGSEVRILASGIYFYVLSADGKLVSKYDDRAELDFTDLVAVKAQGLGRILQNTLILAAGDLDGDGVDELMGDVNDPGYPKVRAWSGRNGKRITGVDRPQDRFLGSGIKTMAAGDVDGDKKDEFVVGADAYLDQLSLYDLENGLLWGRSVGGAADAVRLADINRDGRKEIVVGTELGQVQAIDGAGKLLWIADAGSAVMSLLVTDHAIWAGTVDGRVVMMDMDGHLLAEGHLGGLVDHLESVASDGGVWACSADGQVALFRK